jgi:hypothetical protein
MIELAIDEELRSLISPLTDEERTQLESNLRTEGCRDPLVVWQGEPPADAAHPCQVPWLRQLPLERMLAKMTWLCPPCGETRQQPYVLLDGHHRYAICQQHGLPFDIIEAPAWVQTREEATIWIIQHQLGRRNLAPYHRIELAERLRPLLEKCAQGHQGARTDLRPNFAGSHNTRQGIAAKAGVSRETVRKAEVIMREADEPTKAALRRRERAIDGVYKTLRPCRTGARTQRTVTTPEPAEHLRKTGRLLELIGAMLDLAVTLRGELVDLREQFPQATWASAYDKMQHDLGQMQQYLQALSHRAGAARDVGDESATAPAASAD